MAKKQAPEKTVLQLHDQGDEINMDFWFPIRAVFDESILTVSSKGHIAIDGQTASSDEVAQFLGKLAVAISDGTA